MVGKKIVVFFDDLSFGWLIDEKMFISLTHKSGMEQFLCESQFYSENINSLQTRKISEYDFVD